MKLFYQCEQCEYYIQHYSISEGRIWKVYCGHCKFNNKKKISSLRECVYFKPISEEEQNKQKEQHILGVFKQINISLKYLK